MSFYLDHVQLAIPAGGEPQARLFYGSLLELREISKPEALRSRGGVWFVLDDNRQLHLGVEDPFNPSQKAHPCFVTNSLDALATRLLDRGFEARFDDLIPPVRRFYTKDCFGNRLEFAEHLAST